MNRFRANEPHEPALHPFWACPFPPPEFLLGLLFAYVLPMSCHYLMRRRSAEPVDQASPRPPSCPPLLTPPPLPTLPCSRPPTLPPSRPRRPPPSLVLSYVRSSACRLTSGCDCAIARVREAKTVVRDFVLEMRMGRRMMVLSPSGQLKATTCSLSGDLSVFRITRASQVACQR